MKSYAAILIIILASLILISGCSKTYYVCYDGSVKDSVTRCPTVPVAKITELEAGRAMDNYGSAISIAKRDTYTRVNIYQQNASWYSTILFTNGESGAINKLTFKIDGKSADVTCVAGCDYLVKPK